MIKLHSLKNTLKYNDLDCQYYNSICFLLVASLRASLSLLFAVLSCRQKDKEDFQALKHFSQN
jgi:hypothetical protein